MYTVAAAIAILLSIWTACLVSVWRHNRMASASIAAARAELVVCQGRMLVAQTRLDVATAALAQAGDTILAQAQDIVQAYGDRVAAIVSEMDEDVGKVLIEEAKKFKAQIEVQRVMRRTARQ